MGDRRVLVVVEPGRTGEAALREAARLGADAGAEVALIGVAVQATGPRCGTSILDYNAAVLASLADDLERARCRLQTAGVAASCRVIIDGREPSLEQVVAAGDYALVLLPGRRRLRGAHRHPAADRLRAGTDADIQLVSAGR